MTSYQWLKDLFLYMNNVKILRCHGENGSIEYSSLQRIISQTILFCFAIIFLTGSILYAPYQGFKLFLFVLHGYNDEDRYTPKLHVEKR